MTITNNKGCLSAEEIQRMVNEAEYKDEDDKQRVRKETYNAFNMKITMVSEHNLITIASVNRSCIDCTDKN